MCGINGILSIRSGINLEYRIKNMNAALEHRGPDAEGFTVISDSLALGHRRLAIVDIDKRSNQPMCSATGRWTIVFNGEIYNYKELYSIYEYPFKTKSDTEVILAGLENEKIEVLLNRFNGMFAFAAYDHIENKLYLIRDRLGIKPLYYYIDENYIIFSSEIKGILKSGLVEAQFNEAAIDEYLGNRYVREPYTFFKNIFQVEAGSYLEISRNKIRQNQYWQLPDDFNQRRQYNEEKIADAFEDKLISAIKKRMIADVTVGTYLSGGIDSSLITAIVALNSKSPVNSYTVGFSGLNEFEYAQMVARQYGTKHHSIMIDTKDYFNELKNVILYKDSPLGVPNEIPLSIMSKVLKKHVTVVLSGEGADELLGGYGRIFRAPFDFKYIDKNLENDFYDYFINKYEYVPRTMRDKYLLVDKTIRNYNDIKVKADFKGRAKEECIFRFFHQHHVKGLLQRVDTTTMLAGVEARVPFLDHELIEFSYKSIPYELKLRWNSNDSRIQAESLHSSQYSETLDNPKYLLKRVASKYLPENLVARKKMGFPVPLNEWLISLEEMARVILQDAYWLRMDLFNDLVVNCRKEPRGGQILWMLINLEIFRSMYFEKDWRY